MNAFTRIADANRLIIGLVVLFSAANVATTWLAERSVDAGATASDKRLKVLEAVNLLAKGSDNLTNSARAYAATGDPQYLRAYQTERSVTNLSERATQLLVELGTTSAEMKLVEHANANAQKLAELEDQAIQAAGAGETRKALNLVYGIEYRVAKEDVMSPIAEAYSEIETRQTKEVETLNAYAGRMSRLAEGALLLNILTVLSGLLLYFRKRVVAPVVQLSRLTESLLAGNHDVRFGFLDDGSEIGDLARSLEAYRKTSEQSERLRWINTHAAMITADIQRASGFDELARHLLSRLAPLLELGQASCYRADNERQRLLLCGGYALAGTLKPAAEIAFGSGLLGQCAVEQQPIVLEHPPGDYVRIGSALGSAPPELIVLQPIIGSNGLLGVLELAAFHPLREEQRALLDHLLPTVAMCLEIIQRNQHTESLLKDSLGQAAAMEQQQGEIRKLLEEQQAIFENAPHGILYTADGKFLRANKRLAELLGRSIDELIGQPAAIMYPSTQSYRDFGALVGPILGAGQTCHTEWQFVRKDGSAFLAMVSGQGVRLAGYERAAVWMFEDITERKRMEQTLRESEERLRLILENSPAGVWIGTEDGGQIFSNHRLAELLAIPREELAKRNTTDFWLRPADRVDFLKQLRRDGQVIDYRAEFARSDGRPLTVLLSSTLMADGSGKHIVSWIYDVSGHAVDATEHGQAC